MFIHLFSDRQLDAIQISPCHYASTHQQAQSAKGQYLYHLKSTFYPPPSIVAVEYIVIIEPQIALESSTAMVQVHIGSTQSRIQVGEFPTLTE